MSEVCVTAQTKLSRRQQIIIQAKEVYISDDIPCQIKGCTFCELEQDQQILEDYQIYVLDNEIFEQYVDLIEQTGEASEIKTMIILQSQYNAFKKNQQIINLIDANYSKCIYVYPDEFSVHTQGENPLLKLCVWYQEHQNFVKSKYQINLITQNYSTFKLAEELNINVQTIQDYIKNSNNPNLIDYLGMEIETENQESIFPEHVSIEEAVKQIKQGLLFEGRINFDRNDITQQKIFVKQFQLEIKIKNSNRALNGDRVAVELLPENEWGKQNKNQIQFEDGEEIDIYKEKESLQCNSDNLKNLFKKIQENQLVPFGNVVSILTRTDKTYCGHVEQNIFYPADGRYPAFTLNHPRVESLQDKKIQVQFTNWPSWSMNPLCKLKKILGKAGDLRVEGDLILLEHQVEIREFSHQVLACLPQDGDKYQISQEEINKRWDLRDLPICSIDPIGCRDIDDALHCISLGNNEFEVGVHIADVSYFVKPDTPIDKEAAHRCTTVYLVDRRTDMLPKLLTENLCSLVSNVDRQAFSVIWKMDIQGNILNVRFGKSVIRSVASLNYGQAQEMIDNLVDNSVLTESIRNLNKLAKQLKNKRNLAGALTLASNAVKFSFDEETHNPTDVSMYSLYDTNSLVEEFMLLANISVADKILQRFPAISVLRRHQEPKLKQLKELQSLLNQFGYNFEFDTSSQLSASLDSVQRKDDLFFNKLVRMITTRCMNEALYICTADADFPELYHYGLATQLYTHFTSPIRRYADVLVHRLLTAAIDLESLPASMSNKIRMSRICDKLNMRHRMARFASRASSDYHTYLFFKNKKKQTEQAIITGIQAKGVTVMLPKYGLEGFILADQDENDKLSVNIEGHKHRIFDYIKVDVEVELKNFHKKIALKYV